LQTPHTRLGVETLEVRDCPATAANLFNGVMTVVGSDGADNITVVRSGDWIGVDNQWFATANVGRLVITAGGGDDTIRDETGLGAIIYGGSGNDTIYGGRGADIIYGGQGDDVIYGDRGPDTIYGGAGNNTINGGAGNNAIQYGSPALQSGNSGIEAQIIQLVNNYRASNGLPPLTVNTQLNTAADLHSADMAGISNAYGPWRGMQHTLFGTTRPLITDRLDSVGYDDWSRSFAYGENIAFGYNNAQDVVTGWINSPEHRANILNASYTDTGVSVRSDAAGRLFFTQDFGHLS